MTATMKTRLAKIARVTLVFLLVFWGSFRVETLAWADISGDKASSHKEDEKLTDLVIYKVKSGNKIGDKVVSAADGKKGSVEIKEGDSLKLVAVPEWDGKDSGKGALFVAWKSEDEAIATVKKDNETGVVTVQGAGAGDTTLTCSLNSDADSLDASELENKKLKIAVKVAKKPEEPKEPEKPEEPKTDPDSSSETDTEPDDSGKSKDNPEAPAGGEKSTEVELRVLDGEGNILTTDQGLTLPADQIGKAYALDARMKVTEIVGSDRTTKPEGDTFYSLEEAIAVGVKVTWEPVSGGSIAAVNSNGEITFSEAGTARVHVEATIGRGTASVEFDVTVEGAASGSGDGSGDESDDTPEKPTPVTQGDSNPQDTLTVVSNGLAAPAAEGEGPESSSSSASEATEGEGEGEGPSTIEKTYTASELEALGTASGTYTMFGGGGFVTVTGEGVYLATILRDVGIENTDQIASITFEGAGGTTEVSWPELESANLYYPRAWEGSFEESAAVSPMIATRSLVRGYGDGTGEGADAARASDEGEGGQGDEGGPGDGGPASAGEPGSGSGESEATLNPQADGASEASLVDNTRFRLLFGSTSPAREIASPDALRYINKITVNVKPAEPEPEDPGYDTDISVSIEYVPVPIGAPAVFSALPNTAIRDARFDFQWQVSKDGGKTWEDVKGGNVQVLRVTTTEEGVRGKHQYRVVMSTDATDANGRENVAVTSDPVTMQEGNGLAVVLSYDPPIAGQTAYFSTTLYGAKDNAGIKYTWQQSQDGGATWTDIAGRTGSILAVPTEPIDPNAEKASSDEVVPITYVRVIAEETSGEKRMAISEAVPLTVHVGDESSSNSDNSTPATPAESNEQQTTTDDTKKEKNQRKPRVSETEIVPEYTGMDDASTVPTADGTSPQQLFINDEVTEAVNEQQEAVEEYMENNIPGARWTALSSAQASDDDVRNILADNPFAPFVFPVGLGITVAGGLEKLLAFRRQTK